jgi:Tfp pilus assembly protein PilN
MTINLLPPKLKRRKEISTISNHIIFGLSVILIMLSIMAGAIFLYNSSLAKDISKANSNLSEQNKRLKNFKETETLIKNANKKVSQIDDISKDRFVWSKVITEISTFTPKEVRIENMDLNQRTNSATLSGVATTLKDIALFKEKLEQSGFQNVTFTSSSYNQGTNDYAFSLSVSLEGKK